MNIRKGNYNVLTFEVDKFSEFQNVNYDALCTKIDTGLIS